MLGGHQQVPCVLSFAALELERKNRTVRSVQEDQEFHMMPLGWGFVSLEGGEKTRYARQAKLGQLLQENRSFCGLHGSFCSK